jgi:hypothetical protein
LELVPHASWSVWHALPDPRSLELPVRTDAVGLPPIAQL